MAFLNPSFLWALFAMAIPVIIHLINFRKPKVVYFSNTAFIEDVKKETRTKTKLKQILNSTAIVECTNINTAVNTIDIADIRIGLP